MSHPLQGTILGFNGMIISYAQYNFHQDHVLLTQAYAMSTTATITTLGVGGDPRGSAEIDNESGQNFRMTDADFLIFAHLDLGLESTHNGMGTESKEHVQRDRFFIIMLLADFATTTNLHPVMHNKITDNRPALARALTRCTILLLGSVALTPTIIHRVWGANDTIWITLSGPHGDLTLI